MNKSFQKQRSMGEDSNRSGDGKASKRRRSEDFDFFQRNDLAPKDLGKDIFSRQRTDGKISLNLFFFVHGQNFISFFSFQ